LTDSALSRGVVHYCCANIGQNNLIVQEFAFFASVLADG